MTKRAAIYVRVSTDKQTVENQFGLCRESPRVAVGKWSRNLHDAGISGAKGRKDRPWTHRMLQDAQRRRFRRGDGLGHRSLGSLAN